MRAKYYRFMFQNVKKGMCFTASVAESDVDVTQEFRFLYMSGGAGEDESCAHPLFTATEHYHLMVLADLRPLTVRRAVRFLAGNTVDRVVFPAYEKTAAQELAKGLEAEAAKLVLAPKDYFAARHVKAADALSETEILHDCGQEVRIFCTGTGSEKCLSVYHGSETGNPQTMECQMHVKPFTAEDRYQPMVDAKNQRFEMQFILHQDFMHCKKQNAKNGEYFVDGQLLLGSKDGMEEILSELGDVRSRVRFLGVADGTEKSVPGWEHLGTDGFAQYVAGSADLDAELVKAAVTENPYRQFAALNEASGLCISGYYVER